MEYNGYTIVAPIKTTRIAKKIQYVVDLFDDGVSGIIDYLLHELLI